MRSASLISAGSGAEMHVELRNSPLGPVEVHTVIREASVGAEIHVQGQEAHNLLSASLPGLERALGERSLRVESLAVYQDHAGADTSGGGGESQGQQSNSSPSPHPPVMPWNALSEQATVASTTAELGEWYEPETGLSVQA